MNRIPIKMKCSGLGWTLLTISFCAYAANLFAQTTNLVSFTTFESDGRPRFSYPYHYTYGGADPGGSIESFNTFYYDPNDVGLTNAMGQFVFDDTVFNGFLAANPGGGFGYGFGGGANFDNDTSKFIGTNREDYIVSFDCRVEGLQPGTTSANGEFQIRFDAPDDTIQPPDGDSNSDTLMQVNIGFTATSNLTHYVFTLDQGGLGGGSADDFATYKSAINNINFAMNWNNPEAFGYDGDNAIYIDNVKLEAIQQGATPPPPPTVDIPILYWNFDDRPVDYHYAYTYSQNNEPAFTAQAIYAALGVGDSNANVLTFDNSVFASEPLPGYAGAGSGFSGPMDSSQFVTTNLSSYRLNFDYRVLGLDPSKTSTPGQMQFAFRTNGTTLLTLNFDVSVKTNWQTFSSTLNKGSNGGGSVAAFAQNLTNINSIQPNFQVTGVLGDFGFDNDNYVIIDNVSLVRLQLGLPPLTINRSNNTVVVTWSGPAKLQGGNNVVGPYTDLTGVTNSYTVPITNAARFFRTQWVP
jgi:hypothetical protein